MSGKTIRIIFLVVIPYFLAVALRAEVDGTDERLAAQFLRDGMYEEALALYETLFEQDPTPVIYNNLLETLFALEEFRRAERIVRGKAEKYPGAVRYAVDLAWVNHRAGNDRRARRQIDGLISDLGPNPDDVTDLAMAFERRGFIDRALETYLRGRRLLGERHPLHLRIAEIYEKKEEYQAMMEEYLDYMNEHRQDVERVRGILQDAVTNDPGFKRNDALRQVLLSRTQRSPQNILYSEMLLWLSVQQQDFRMAFMQARALDRRLGREGMTVLEVADLSVSNKNYQVAADAYQYVLDMGEEGTYYLDAMVGYLNVRFLSVTEDHTHEVSDLLAIEKEYQQAIANLGISATTVQLVRNLAHLQAFFLEKTEEAIGFLEATIGIPDISSRVRGECQIELADILLLSGEVWDATLLYAQVDRIFRDDPLAHEARFKNARLTYYIGEFDWATAQLDVLKAGTSRLIANDAMKLSLRIQDNLGINGNPEPLKMFAQAEKHIFMNRFGDAIATLDSVAALFPGHQINDDLLFARADIKLRRGDPAAADSLLALIVERYSGGVLADEALFRRAELHHHYLEQQDKAMALYQQLMLDYPGSLYTVTARQRFRELRGDIVN